MVFSGSYILSLAQAVVLLGVPAAALKSTITAAPPRPTELAEDIIGYSQTTTYETTSPLPLTDYYYAYSAVPYQVNPYPIGRGPQSGYNQCNSTTEGPDSQCQTLEFNSIDDFCMWGSPGLSPNETTGDIEAAVVKYCTKSGHGGRILPEGTFTGLQFMRTPAYIQITGWLDQTKLGLEASDPGGELDPHGADDLGNPLGGLVYSKSLPSGDNTTYQQTQSWNQFFNGQTFCIKLCDPNYTGDDKNYCQNIYDIIGCNYNMPAAYENNVFLSCEGDLQDEVGTYTSDGQTYTWSQPTSLPASSTLPWTPRIPASSNCVTYQSTDLFPRSDLGYLAGSAASSTVSSATTTAMQSMNTGSMAASSRTSGNAAVASASTSSKTSGAMLTSENSRSLTLAAMAISAFGAAILL